MNALLFLLAWLIAGRLTLAYDRVSPEHEGVWTMWATITWPILWFEVLESRIQNRRYVSFKREMEARCLRIETLLARRLNMRVTDLRTGETRDLWP